MACANLEKLAGGCRWTEGPACFPASRYLVWSDIPNNRMMRYDGTDDSVSVFRQPSFNSNGYTVDREGRLITCEHLARRLTRTEHDGSVTVLAERYHGDRLDSPNDAIVRSHGSIWFSDPIYGNEGRQGESEIGSSNVYRIDGGNGNVTLIASSGSPSANRVPLRQSYLRLVKRAAIMVDRYTQAHQFKRAGASSSSCGNGSAGSSVTSAARLKEMRCWKHALARCSA
jgi:hypothetical protein